MDKKEAIEIIQNSYNAEDVAKILKSLRKLEHQTAIDTFVDRRIAALYPLLHQIRSKNIDALIADKQICVGMMNSLISSISNGFQARVNGPLSAVAELVFFGAVLADLIVKQVTIFLMINNINKTLCEIITERNITKYYYPLPVNDADRITTPSEPNPPSTMHECGQPEPREPPEPPPIPQPGNGGSEGGGGNGGSN